MNREFCILQDMHTLFQAYHQIQDPEEFFKGWTKVEFMTWLQTTDEPLEQHRRSVKAILKKLEQAELYELCALTKLYLDFI